MCAECAYYSMKTHKCGQGCIAEPNRENGDDVRFFADCPFPNAVEERNGKWRKCKDGTDFDGETVCSECNGVSPNGWWWKFCPHCGAKMHGGESDA